MELDEAIRTRRTHKAYRQEPVERATLDELFELARWAPNHNLTNPWRFRVLGPKARERLKAGGERRPGASGGPGTPDTTTESRGTPAASSTAATGPRGSSRTPSSRSPASEWTFERRAARPIGCSGEPSAAPTRARTVPPSSISASDSRSPGSVRTATRSASTRASGSTDRKLATSGGP